MFNRIIVFIFNVNILFLNGVKEKGCGMIKTDIANAEKFSEWIKTRGGIAQWNAIDFSGESCFTPLMTDGAQTRKPHWKYPEKPHTIITDAAEVSLITVKEVKRFYVTVRIGDNGLRLKVTDGSSRKINRTLDKLGTDAWYEFDYNTREVVFYLPDSSITLKQWEENEKVIVERLR
jgi:hypothetical protein